MKLKSLEEIKFVPLRKKGGKIYYFNQDGIIATSSPACLPDPLISWAEKKFRTDFPKAGEECFTTFLSALLSRFRPDEKSLLADEPLCDKASLILKRAIAGLEEGDTYEKLEKRLEEREEYYRNLYKIKKEKGEYHNHPEGLDRFIARICKPIILREPENDNPDTFDIIKVQMELITEWEEDRKRYICSNKEEIVRRAVEKIRTDRGFRRYGVEVNVLALTKMMMLDRNTLELIFELKREIREEI